MLTPADATHPGRGHGERRSTLTPAEAADFAWFIALRGAEGPVEEVRDLVLAMIELYHGRATAILTDCQASYTISL